MKGSRPMIGIGLLALLAVAATAVAAWKGWRLLTGRDQPALAPGYGRPAGIAPPAASGSASPSAAPPVPASFAEDEASALRAGEAAPETAEEIAKLLPEPDVSLTGIAAEGATVAADQPQGEGERSGDEAGGAEAVDTVLEVRAARVDTEKPAAALDRFGPDAAPPDEGGACPPDFPIKGNTNSMIYHLPGQPSYGVTMAGVCFATAEAAEQAGFRPRKR